MLLATKTNFYIAEIVFNRVSDLYSTEMRKYAFFGFHQLISPMGTILILLKSMEIMPLTSAGPRFCIVTNPVYGKVVLAEIFNHCCAYQWISTGSPVFWAES